MKHEYREPNDFLLDASFIDWVTKKNEQHIRDWENWIKENPAKKYLVDEAAQMASQIIVKETVEEAQVAIAADRLIEKITIMPAKIMRFNYKKWIAVAASVLIVVAGSIFYFNNSHTQSQVQSRYGEIVKQTLPDGSEVILNANSKIHYAANFSQSSEREVWIDGEAFFHVKKTPLSNSFTVHTNRFDIVVTGTRFNVINSTQSSSVVLKEGSVTVTTKDGRIIYMHPGESVELKNTDLIKKKVEADDAVAWTEEKIVLNKTPLSEVVKIISEHYGVEVTLADTSLNKETLTGILPNNNLDVVLKAIETTSEFSVEKTSRNSIKIKRNKP